MSILVAFKAASFPPLLQDTHAGGSGREEPMTGARTLPNAGVFEAREPERRSGLLSTAIALIHEGDRYYKMIARFSIPDRRV